MLRNIILISRNRSVRQGFSNYRRRVILKSGECNVIRTSIARKRLRFVLDFFTTFVDAQWRWNLIAFVLSFFISWLIFGLVWWLMAFTHGDLEEDHLPPMQESTNWQPCVLNIFGYTSCFLFSIETQHTIGYGSRVITDECPEAIFIMCLQSMFGVMIQSFMGAIMLAKMMRPRQRSSTLLFSKYAVISHRDGDLCLMFRVGDLQKSHMLGASVRAQLIKHKTTKEGELLPYYQTELELNADGCDSNLFFIWPVTMVHRITPDSPLYGVTAKEISQQRFEIVVALDGTVESTGQTTQARSSYTNGELLWAHRFVPMVAFNRDLHSFEVDYAKFDQTCHVDTPLCSAKNMDDFYHSQEEHKSIGK